MAQPPRIIIAGGGAGGLELAIALAAQVRRYRGMAEIILLDCFPTHFWKPRLHEIAAGAPLPESALQDYAGLAARHGFRFVEGRMAGLDIVARQVNLAGGEPLGYEYLVLALGSLVNDFNTPGVAEHCDMLDDVPQAERLRQRIRDAARAVRDGNAARLGIAIIGAGATGVELGAEIQSEAGRHPDFQGLLETGKLHITILDMAERVLPAAAADLSSAVAARLRQQGIRLVLGQRVTEVSGDAVHLADGQVIEASVKIWASGVKAPDWLKHCKFLQLAHDNRIRVDASLRCLGQDRVFALGDCAAFTPPGGERPLPPTAQAAHQEGRFLARALPRLLRGARPGMFSYRDYGILVSLGQRGVIGQTGGNLRLRLSGAMARLMYDGLYQSHVAALDGWPSAIGQAASQLWRRTPGIALKLHNVTASS